MEFQPEARFVCGRTRHLINFFLLFILLTWNHVKLIAEGRAIPKWKIDGVEIVSKQNDEEKEGRMRILIGSRPPRCEIRCRSCGHCEAVQVPIVPVLKHQQTTRTTSSSSRRRRRRQFFATPTIAYSRGDDISNYKPMCWKCKCGDILFNP